MYTHYRHLLAPFRTRKPRSLLPNLTFTLQKPKNKEVLLSCIFLFQKDTFCLVSPKTKSFPQPQNCYLKINKNATCCDHKITLHLLLWLGWLILCCMLWSIPLAEWLLPGTSSALLVFLVRAGCSSACSSSLQSDTFYKRLLLHIISKIQTFLEKLWWQFCAFGILFEIQFIISYRHGTYK